MTRRRWTIPAGIPVNYAAAIDRRDLEKLLDTVTLGRREIGALRRRAKDLPPWAVQHLIALEHADEMIDDVIVRHTPKLEDPR